MPKLQAYVVRRKVRARQTGRLKIQARPGFCGTRAESAGLMLGSGVEITRYYALAAGLRAVLESCLLGLMLGSPDFVR